MNFNKLCLLSLLLTTLSLYTSTDKEYLNAAVRHFTTTDSSKGEIEIQLARYSHEDLIDLRAILLANKKDYQTKISANVDHCCNSILCLSVPGLAALGFGISYVKKAFSQCKSPDLNFIEKMWGSKPKDISSNDEYFLWGWACIIISVNYLALVGSIDPNIEQEKLFIQRIDIVSSLIDEKVMQFTPNQVQ